MFEDRFKEVFSQIEIELAQSFPVINHDCEFLFFYSTSGNDEYSYKINKIEYIFSRNIFNAEIKRIEFCDIDQNLINKCSGEIICPSIFDEEAFVVEDSYYSNYEVVYDAVLNGMKINNKVAKQLLQDFERLIPDGSIKDLYKKLGRQMFDFLNF